MTLLDQLPYRAPATVSSVAWDRLTPTEARRLRNLGLSEGVQVEALHAGPFGRDPLAIRIGRMMVAIRRAHAQAITVEPIASAEPALAAAPMMGAQPAA